MTRYVFITGGVVSSLGKGILKIKKKTLTKKELEKAKRIGRHFHEEIILPKKLAKKAEIEPIEFAEDISIPELPNLPDVPLTEEDK